MAADSTELLTRNALAEKQDEDYDNDPRSDSSVNVIQPKLDKTLGVLGGIGLVVGSIIGSGIFLSPKGVILNTGSVGLSLIVWVLCGLCALFGALCYVELGTAIPKSGAEYSYLFEAFKASPLGAVLAFLYAWTATLIIRPSAVAIIAMIFAEYVSKPFYDSEEIPIWVIKLVAFGCIGKYIYSMSRFTLLFIHFIKIAKVKFNCYCVFY